MFGVYPNCSMSLSKSLVWIGGNTYPVRSDLKADGFKWSPKKKMWWMPIDEYKVKINSLPDDEEVFTGHIDGKGDDGYTDLAGRLDYDLGY